MRKSIIALLLVSSVFLFSNTPLYAGGLSTTFVEVTLQGLEPGNSYSVQEKTGKTLIVENTTEGVTVDIEIEAETPVEHNLVPGYEPIPDLSWVMVEKNYFKDVGPNKTAETNLTITIPKDEDHYGKKYQVYIYSHTAGKATFRMGLMSRLLLHIVEK